MKMAKKTISVLLTVVLCLSMFAMTFTVSSSAVKYAYTGNQSTKITGWHHWPNNCLGGVDITLLGANEVSTSGFDFRTNYEGTAGQPNYREMTGSQAPIATYYVDPADGEFSVSMLCEMTENQWAQIINCQFASNATVQSNCSVDTGWATQWYFKQGGEIRETNRTVTFTGKTPSAPGQTVDYPLFMYADIANGQSGYIHAIYKMVIRFVAFGTTESGKKTVTNTIIRNLSNVFCYNGTISAYNVDGGTNGSYNNGSDTNYSANDGDFKLLSTADAYVYIDRTKYSKFEDTPVSFSHKVGVLCGNGTGGWSWAGIRVAGTTGSFTSSVGNVDYTVDNTKGTSFLPDVYNIPFKVCGALPAAGTPLTITVAGYYDANATTNGHFYNSHSNLNLAVYLYDKTQLNAKISELSAYTSKGAEYSADSFKAFTDAYNAATTVADGQSKQSEIDTAKNNLVNAFNALKTIHTVTWKNYDGTVLETDENVEYGSTPSYDGETPTKASDVQYTYTFKGWSSEISEVTEDVTYTATFTSTLNKYTITWYDEDGTTVLATSKVSFGSIPSYPGTVAPKKGNNTNHYVHDGWTVTPVAVSGDASYTAKYKTERHTLAYTNLGEKHSARCAKCGYETTPASHRIGEDGTCEFCGSALADYTVVRNLISTVPSSIYYTESSYNAFLSTIENDVDWGIVDGQQSTVDNVILPQVQAAINALEIKTYPVTLPSNCSVSYSRITGVNYYMMATVTAPTTSGTDKFAYWADENGNVVSTYRNYSFVSVTPRNLHPVYGEVTEDKYISTEVLGVRDNLDGTYSILVEHSASSRVAINAHGVLFTFDEGSKSDLVFRTSNDSVYNPVAARTYSTRTGLFEVKISKDSIPAGVDTIYLKSYVIKTDSETPVYSESVAVSISGAATNASTSFTVDELSTQNPSEYEPSPMPDYQLNFFEKVAAFVLSVWKFVVSIFVK